jgi:hypothetical protein
VAHGTGAMGTKEGRALALRVTPRKPDPKRMLAKGGGVSLDLTPHEALSPVMRTSENSPSTHLGE